MTKADRFLVLRYTTATVSVALAVLVRRLLDPALGDEFPFATLFFAVTFSAWYGGFGPALLAVVLGALSSAYFLLPPRGSLAVQGWDQQVGMALYLSVSMGIALLGGAMRAARYRAEAHGLAEHVQREQLRVTLESIGDAVIVTDAEGRVTLLNPAAQALTGWRMEDASAQPLEKVFKIINETTECAVESPVAKVLREGIVVGLANHTVLIASDGTQRPIDDSGAPIKDAAGMITGVVLVFRDVTQRRRLERLQRDLQSQLERQVQERTAELRGSEQRFRLLVEGTRDYAIFMLDPEGRVVSWDPGAERIKGYRADEIIGQHFSRFYPAEAFQTGKPERALQVATAEGRYEEEGWRVRKDGSQFWASVVITALREEAGNLRGFSKITRDMTERKQAEESARRLLEEQAARTAAEEGQRQLRASEERLRLFVEHAPAAVAMFDRNMDYLLVSKLWLSDFGLEDRTITGRNHYEVFSESPERCKEVHRRCLAGAVEQCDEDRFVRADGAADWLRWEVRPWHDDRGEVGGLIVFSEIITKRKQSLEALRASEERMRSVVDHVIDGIIAIDDHGLVQSFNPAAEKLFGYRASEVIGHNVNVLMPEPYHGEHDQYLANYLRTGEAKIIGVGREVVGRRKDGSTFPMELAISEFYLEDRRHFTGIVRDVSQRKKLEEQLRQAQKMEAVGQLAGGVAHDFNNLLTVISGYSDMLLSRLATDDTGSGLVQEIYKAGERAAGLTRQLLAFSRKQVLEPKVLDLNTIVGEAGKMLRRLIGEDISLTTVLAPDLGAVKVDPGQVEQVIINLAVNARDAMPQGGKLTIETGNVDLDESYAQSHFEAKPGRYAMLAVSDTGHGMDEATQARIFEPFFTTKGPGKGTGLGLATVYGIVKQSGGSIGVYSEPGHGTAFKVYLPVVEERIPSGKSHPGLKVALQGTETVLLVEDEPAVRSLSRLALQMYGYKVLEASQGDDAIRVCEQHGGTIHLLVTDVVMPGMSGRELIETLRPRHPAMKVLFVSGYTDDAIVRHGVLAAETAFLQKPFTPLTLATKLREVLDG